MKKIGLRKEPLGGGGTEPRRKESVDGVALPVATERVKALVDAYASVPAEPI